MDASNGEPASQSSPTHDECKSRAELTCETGSEKSFAIDSNSDSDYDPHKGVQLTTYNYYVNVNDFMNLHYAKIPIFSGYSFEITSAFFDLIEKEWAQYLYLQAHWVSKVRSSYLSNEAQKVADDFIGYDWLLFRSHMEKWFPTSNARMHKRYMMVDSQNYLVDLDMRQAVAQARKDYEAQGNEYDAPEPAGILAKRIPPNVQAKYDFVLYRHTSGRDILKLVEEIVWKEKVELCNEANWLKPLKPAADNHPACFAKSYPSTAMVACSSTPQPALTTPPASANSRMHPLH
ncbi:hypothetical protein IWW36_002404 [Coemansia brasiliensis]|uniref:Uncharacterized protein n=1 Tax=Coemansia brasiliensis TaxID=2650707 RepID=A0A9W8M0P0_9FUNG|nr:hypothetical protein IWW36_002404 [Coemansia brasiliensis]